MAHPFGSSSSTCFLNELEFGIVGFWGEGTTGVPGEKPPEESEARERTIDKLLDPHMLSTPGSEPGHVGGRRLLSQLRHPCFLNLSKNLHVRSKKWAPTQKQYHYWWHILMVLLDVKFLLYILSRPLNSIFRPTERKIKTGRTFTYRLHSTPCG